MLPPLYFLFFFNDTATTEIYTLSLHDALPICVCRAVARRRHLDGHSTHWIGRGRGHIHRRGSRLRAATLDDLGEDAQRDLLGQARADVQAGGIVHLVERLARDPALEQRLAHLREPLAARDHRDVRAARTEGPRPGLLSVLAHGPHDPEYRRPPAS